MASYLDEGHDEADFGEPKSLTLPESLIPEGAIVKTACFKPPELALYNPSSPSANKSESDSVGLTQRRSIGSEKTALKSERSDSRSSTPTNTSSSVVPPWKVFWILIAIAALTLAVTFLVLGYPSGMSAIVERLHGWVYSSVFPVGAKLWTFQWQYQGRPDPRPLWSPAMLGKEATWLHGSSKGLAEAMKSSTSESIAIVGNGPLSDRQRKEIQEADIVVRFNAMNNRRANERVDLWVLRNNHVPPYLYWGLEQLGDDEITQVLDKVSALLLLADYPSTGLKVDKKAEALVPASLQFWFPNARSEQLYQVDISSYWDTYSRLFSKKGHTSLKVADVMPSSGLLGILAALDTVKNTSRIDVYGFNWSDRSYAQHQMSNEELIVQALKEAHPRLQIHPTPCNGLYHCNQICDTAQFRLAVDEENCNRQLAKATLGEQPRFIDKHTTQHLDWHAALKAELQDRAKKAGIKNPTQALLSLMAKTIAEDSNKTYSLAPFRDLPPPSAKELTSLPEAIQRVSITSLLSSSLPESQTTKSASIKSNVSSSVESHQKAVAVSSKSSQGHSIRKLKRPQFRL